MKVYSDTITRMDIEHAVAPIEDVYVEDFRAFSPRKGGNGYELFLYGAGERHKRRSAHAPIGGRSESMAATWTDFGVMIAALFKIDPRAEIAFYNGVGEFIAETERATESYRSRNEAPWLADTELHHKARLEALRAELRAEQISYGELAELQGLAEHIDPGDIELLEAAGVPE